MNPTLDPSPAVPRVGVPVMVYVVAVLGAVAAIKTWSLRGVPLAIAIAVPIVALAWMIVVYRAARRAAGPTSAAHRTYVRRFIPLMIGYAALLMGAVWIGKQYQPGGVAAFALAILPALPLVGVIWAMGRLIVEESDEYQRSLTIRQFLVATGFMLAVTSVWGFLESSGQVPHLPMYWAFILWCGGLGVGSIVNELKR